MGDVGGLVGFYFGVVSALRVSADGDGVGE